jgi:hypothetical protein
MADGKISLEDESSTFSKTSQKVEELFKGFFFRNETVTELKPK